MTQHPLFIASLMTAPHPSCLSLVEMKISAFSMYSLTAAGDIGPVKVTLSISLFSVASCLSSSSISPVPIISIWNGISASSSFPAVKSAFSACFQSMNLPAQSIRTSLPGSDFISRGVSFPYSLSSGKYPHLNILPLYAWKMP